MRYFPFLQYVMRFCSGTSKATDDGGIIKVSLVSKQSLSPLSLATFDSASRQRRSRRRLAAFTSTQGSRKISRPLDSLQNCEKTVREKSPLVGTDVLGGPPNPHRGVRCMFAAFFAYNIPIAVALLHQACSFNHAKPRWRFHEQGSYCLQQLLILVH